MKMMLPDVIGHENQSQHYRYHRCLCLDLSGRINTPDRFSYHTGLTQIAAKFRLSLNFYGRLSAQWFSGLKSVYFSVAFVDGQQKQRKPPETHFPKSQTSTENRRSYTTPSLRVKITIIFSSIQLSFALLFFVNPLTRRPTIGPSY